MRAQVRTAVASVATAVLVSVGHGTPATAAMGNVRQSTSPAAVPGSYLVVLHTQDPSAVQTFADRLVSKKPVTLTRGFHRALNGFVIDTDARTAAKLADHPEVAFVEQDQLMHVTGHALTPLLSRAHLTAGGGEGVHVYVVDTGVNSPSGGPDLVDGDAVSQDCHGHGTAMATTIAEVAGQAGIVGVRVLGCTGEGPVSTVIAGIDWVIANAAKPAVLHLGFGGSPSDATDLAVQRAIDTGLTVVVAADDETACHTSPARAAQAITVGTPATGLTSCLDLFAPVRSTSDEAAVASPALVTGAAALLLAAHPTWSPQQVRDQLVAQARINRFFTA